MKNRSKNLSKREKEVAGLLLEGKSNKQLAFVLGIKESTVEFHLRNMYAKLEVNSRAEAILKLGKSTGLIAGNLGETRVEMENRVRHTGGTFMLRRRWISFVKDSVSTIKQEIEMKNRLLSYFLAGLTFGILFWFHFGAIGKVMNRFHFEEKPLVIWAVLSIEFLLIFGVWLIPTIFPMRAEFRRSKKVNLSVVAVMVSWMSAVLGYYLIYVVFLAFTGLPNMEYYLVFGHHGPTFWQDLAELFPRLIFFKFLQWTVVGEIVGGFAGVVTSSLYAFWVRKTATMLST